MQMEHTIEIKKIITGGLGLGYLPDGMVAMVPFCLPGETVLCREKKRYSGHIELKSVTIITPSQTRIKPPCPLYGNCGGCDLQHAAYPAQLDIKFNILKESLQRAGLGLDDGIVRTALPSPSQFGYRNQLRMHLSPDGSLGFHRQSSNTVIPVDACPVAGAPINQALKRLHESALLPSLAHHCAVLEILQSPADERITIVLHLRDGKNLANTLIKRLEQLNGSHTFLIKSGRLLQQPAPGHNQSDLSQELQCGRHTCLLSWDAGCFFQANSGQNRQLVSLVCSLAGDVHDRQLLDLYCGMGNFSIPLALNGARITGIEHNQASVFRAIRNAAAAGLSCTFTAAKVENILGKFNKTGKKFDTILVDPPRQGIGRAGNLLPRLSAEQIIYISCDPATLARDLVGISANGYHVSTIIPVDMFPQTHHIESVALLEKN
ncbi:MAG: methyltransferase domain-containing protein [Desulfobulbaceae bacterium]|nr:methyltransferase domain-containing protein [Desulfobulbaceae bacterium]